MNYDKKIIALSDEADLFLKEQFDYINSVSLLNTKKVLEAFKKNRVSQSAFIPSTGYAYGDRGRETLDSVFADVFGAESALVRHNFVNGTHAIATALFALLRPGDTMLSVTGTPYDTLHEVIFGNSGQGSLKEFGINYKEVPIDTDFESEITPDVKVVYIQRSRGYQQRRTLTVSDINQIVKIVKSFSEAYVVVDNCYGEFTETTEPDADLIVGSLIKNPGGGIARTGGYIAGKKKAVDLASYRLTIPGTGNEVGATLGETVNMFKGIFFAPSVTASALKTAHFAAYIFEKLGFETSPKSDEKRSDIIETVKLNSPEALCAFCRGIQSGSPVDSYVTPEPWDMPGYEDKVIMAAGTFTEGASIELSADGPLRPPYIAFMQGGLTYESGKIGVMTAAQYLIDEGIIK